MKRYIFTISIAILLLIFTLLNLSITEGYMSLNFLIYKTPKIPGIILLYVGMLLGSLFTIPLVFKHLCPPTTKVLTEQVKEESKREKKFNKNFPKVKHKNKEKKGNINSVDIPISNNSNIDSE